jgi:hypothetical protein
MVQRPTALELAAAIRSAPSHVRRDAASGDGAPRHTQDVVDATRWLTEHEGVVSWVDALTNSPEGWSDARAGEQLELSWT